MSELKPCPFCGKELLCFGNQLLNNDVVKGYIHPEANENEFRCPLTRLVFTADKWNTRAEPLEITNLREQVKVLREALEDVLSGNDLAYNRRSSMDSWMGSYVRRQCHDSLAQTKPKNEDPEKLARLIAARVKCFGLLSARKLVSGLGTLDNIINAEPADLDAIFGKGSIKSIHLREYLSYPANVDHLRLKAQAKPKDGE